ncbi:MAG TPA: hypothetical protein VGX03_35705 [Candidatus Binatia bacterium]|jgi:hypothetical protein|nr:hypothetical protein [Candidatus Binatia bacterium]
MSLFHLVLFFTLFATFSSLASRLLAAIPVAQHFLQSGTPLSIALFSAVFAGVFVLTLVVAWAIAKRIHLTPLRIWTPRCPHCDGKSDDYRFAERAWPSIRLECPKCNGQFLLLMRRANSPTDGHTPLPTYALRWPEFLGLWRRVA